jgi:signal transduction histidine kinase
MKVSNKKKPGRQPDKTGASNLSNGSRVADLKQQILRLEEMRSELQQTADGLRSALEALAADSISKSQFLATMSHELRTPLNAIMGFSEILKDEILGSIGSPRYRDYAASIHKSGGYLLHLVNELLDFSKLDAGKLELIEEPIDVGKMIGECIHLIEPQAAKGKVAVRELPRECRFILKADDRRLRQILLNLLSNAVKFTPEGGDVRVSAKMTSDGLAIAVADTGIGIAQEDIPRALERFGQIDSALSRKHHGTGLGLPLAKHLAELHAGALTIQSEFGAGTTVTVTFPSSRMMAERVAA